eukprot:m.38589 g.38589  ORF g.38589 m.38589 type:complete len:614 (+) comp9452_c0_seq2:199-2040(+)
MPSKTERQDRKGNKVTEWVEMPVGADVNKIREGNVSRRQGFRGNGSFNEELLQLFSEGRLYAWKHEDIARKNNPPLKEDDELPPPRPQQLIDLQQTFWFTCNESDLKELAIKHEFEWDAKTGLAMESHEGRYLFLSFKSSQERDTWVTDMRSFLPPGCENGDASRQYMLNPGKLQQKSADEMAFSVLEDAGPAFVADHSPVNLYLDLCVNNVELETRDNTFYLDMWVQMVWEDKRFKDKHVSDPGVLEELKANEPEIEFLNQMKMERVYENAAHSRSIVTEDGKTFIQCVRRYLGTMKDLDVDIRDFPFDTQVLEVQVQVFGCPVQTRDNNKLFKIIACRIEDIRYTDHKVLEMLRRGQYKYVSELHGLEQETWTLLASNVRVKPVKYDFLGISYATMQINFVIQRRYQYFFWKIFFVELIVALLSFLAFGFMVNEYEQRINVIVALFLANAAFQFVTQESTPYVQYLTRLDMFLEVIYAVQVGVAVESFIVNHYAEDNPELANDIDYYARVCMPGLFGIYILYYALSAWKLRYNDRRYFWRSPMWTRMDPKTCEPLNDDGTKKDKSFAESAADAIFGVSMFSRDDPPIRGKVDDTNGKSRRRASRRVQSAHG